MAPIVTVLDERREAIQKGLQQADEAKNELAKAHEKAEETVHLAAQKAKKGGRRCPKRGNSPSK